MKAIIRLAKVAMYAAVLISNSATAFTPLTGHWWNPNESGSGYNIDIQNGVLVVTVYSYKTNGDSEWYLASGPLTNANQHEFVGTLDKYRNGQCISCSYSGRPTLVGNDGQIFIDFLTETSANITLPGGRSKRIQPYNFGYGNPPQSLFGEWVYVYDIVAGSITFAERFDYSVVVPGTANGNGIATDPGRIAGCEYQITGPAEVVNHVLCVDLDAAGNLVNGYIWQFGLGETFDGFWISPTTYRQYPMKGFRIRSNSGNPRMSLAASLSTNDLAVEKRLEESRAVSTSPVSEEVRATIASKAEQMRQRLLDAR